MPLTDSLKLVEVLRIDQYSLTAGLDDVAYGKTFIGNTRQISTGSLPILTQHDTDVVLNPGSEYTVEYGKNPKQYKITTPTLSSTTPGTASPSDILINKEAWVNGTLITGEMPDNGAVKAEVVAGQVYTIPKGYHNGTGTVSVAGLDEQTAGTATEEDILYEKTAWVNGVQLVGSMPIIADETVVISAGNEYVIPLGKHSGNGKVRAMDLADETPATAESGDILDGETAWVNGSMITGTIPKITSSTVYLPVNGEYVIPQGYHSGLGRVTQNIPAIEEQVVIAPSFEQQIIPAAGMYMTQDILVPGIDALNYQRTGTEYVVDDEELGTGLDGAITKTYAVSVDNWHDNATLNVYEVAIGAGPDGSTDYTYIAYIDWADSRTFTITSPGITIGLSLEDGTNAHLFSLTIDDGTDAGYHFRVRELFHARRYGDDHDVDDPDTEEPTPEPEPEPEPGGEEGTDPTEPGTGEEEQPTEPEEPSVDSTEEDQTQNDDNSETVTDENET